MRLTVSSDFGKITTLQEIIRWTAQFVQQASQAMSGNLEFDVNLRTSTVLGVVFPAANTNVNVTHRLNRVPIGYLIAGSSAACSIFTSTIPATALTITLQSSTAATCTIVVF